MVEDALVAPDAEAAHRLVSILDAAGMPIKAALSAMTSKSDDWRLWMAPDAPVPDKRAFYEDVSRLVSRNRATLPGFDVGAIEIVPADHPALRSLRQIAHVEGRDFGRFSKTMLDGFYMDEAVVVRLR